MQTTKLESPVTQVMSLPQAGRSLALGRTGSGKSTLMDLLLKRYLSLYPKAKALIIDSKPRFKAHWLPSGLAAKSHYKNWSRGEFLPHSYRIPNDLPVKRSMDESFSYGARIVVAQTTPGRVADLRWLAYVTEIFYGEYSDREPRIILVDELADFFAVHKGGGDIFWQAARSGRELNIALLAGSQRPRYIPPVVMTESDRVYLFKLDYNEDMKHVYSMGIPRDVQVPKVPHSFYYWDKQLEYAPPSGQTYVLELNK